MSTSYEKYVLSFVWSHPGLCDYVPESEIFTTEELAKFLMVNHDQVSILGIERSTS